MSVLCTKFGVDSSSRFPFRARTVDTSTQRCRADATRRLHGRRVKAAGPACGSGPRVVQCCVADAGEHVVNVTLDASRQR